MAPPQRFSTVGMGSYADVVQISDSRVWKVPKIYPIPKDNPELADRLDYSNYVNRGELENEMAVYKRLGNHDGIIHFVEALDESIELELATDGDLDKYIGEQPAPRLTLRRKWIQSLAEAFAYVHSRRVVVQDVALRNILVHHTSLKLCDFGDSSLLPLDTDMAGFCESNTTPQIEMLHVGCIFYSVATWERFKYDYYDNDRFPVASDLPSTDGVLFATIIQKCWNGEYASMEALRDDVLGTKEE